ncbi:CDP-glycerol glycerophosphotransferase family protein [Pseudobutyrivibrio sp. OR37]|uniref:CDP-glycerol glycerophosphotransferase family protein n=1 Tax=Pseudobutyrivibrio sp. OR37 TaxID=1798186 RepID=UPI000B859A10|nr:CDP-glycerol glycerophosphotransferase family protein [Pseudobutyrivibrio sp. OR37]
MGKKSTEEKYIKKRKIKAFFYSFPFYICRVFPIQKNKIVLWTLEGNGGYSCNPRYIAEEILKRNAKGETDYDLVWITKKPSLSFPDGIKVVKDTIWNRAFQMTTARVWIGNTRTFLGTRKRKGTTYIQTWHGSISLKPIGKCRGNKLSEIAYLVSKTDSDLIDIAISGSKWCTNMWPKGLIYDGDIKEIGTPRFDILINSVKEKHQLIRERYEVPNNAKIAIYAPTFRGGSQALNRSVNEKKVSLDFDRVIDAFEKRFGGEWYLFLRLHPQLADSVKKMNIANTNSKIIDVTQADDMNELMAATDAIITDYSTVIFEGFLTGQPGFIYADDLEEYVDDRGNLMFSLDEIPFSYAKSTDELVENILSFDDLKYREESTNFRYRCGIVADGKASKRVVDIIGNITSRQIIYGDINGI